MTNKPPFIEILKDLAIPEHFNNMFGKLLLDFPMSWNRLRNFSSGILIPIVFPTMTHKDTSHVVKFFKQISAFHDISSSATLRTAETSPLDKSL